MRFFLETERLQHPTAGRIPRALWVIIFQYTLPDQLMPFFENDKTIDAVVEQIRPILLSYQDDQAQYLIVGMKIFIILLLTHPTWTFQMMQPIVECVGWNVQNESLLLSLGGNCWQYESILLFLAIDCQQYTYLRTFLNAATWQQLSKEKKIQSVSGTFSLFSSMELVGEPRLKDNCLTILNALMQDMPPGNANEILEIWGCHACVYAASHGEITTLEALMQLAKEHLKTIPERWVEDVLVDSIRRGQIAVLEQLAPLAPSLSRDQWRKAIALDDYSVLRNVVIEKRLDILDQLIAWAEWTTEEAKAHLSIVMQAHDYAALHLTLAHYQSDVVNRLREWIPEVIQAFMEDRERVVALLSGFWPCDDLITLCIQFSAGLDYLERHYFDMETETFSFCHHHVGVFVDNSMQILRDQLTTIDFHNPQIAQQYFYCLRNLIRRNQPAYYHDNIALLLSIAEVRALVIENARQRLSRHDALPNELFHLAQSINNQNAMQQLLTIEAVREAALAAHREGGTLDLRMLAAFSESAMRGLTPQEHQQLTSLREHYAHLNIHTDRVIQALLQTLEDRYHAQPAFIKQGEEQIKLPLRWAAFQVLSLTDVERSNAEQAYYKHMDHTAWRYFQKPNRWINPSAAFVRVNPSNPEERWADFDQHLEIIALLYIAARDENALPTDGHTLASRLDCLIQGLALINRAHNWDGYRAGAHAESEQYDNLLGDQPSCGLGVLRRLFESLLGHPYFKPSIEQYKAHLRECLVKHFKDIIETIPDGYQKVFESYTRIVLLDWEHYADDKILLEKLHIPPARYQQWIAEMKVQYGNMDVITEAELLSYFDIPKDDPWCFTHVLSIPDTVLNVHAFLAAQVEQTKEGRPSSRPGSH